LAVDVATFKTEIEALVVLIKANDWAGAWTQYTVCEVVNAGIEAEVSDEGARIRRREELKGIRNALSMAEGASNRTNRKRLVTSRTNYHGNSSNRRGGC